MNTKAKKRRASACPICGPEEEVLPKDEGDLSTWSRLRRCLSIMEIKDERKDSRIAALERDLASARASLEGLRALYDEMRKSHEPLHARVKYLERENAELREQNKTFFHRMEDAQVRARHFETVAMSRPAHEPQDARDAARYRWLRKFPTHFATEEWGKYGAGLRLDKVYVNTPEKLDAVIDEAMGQSSETSGVLHEDIIDSENWCPQCSHPRGACVCDQLNTGDHRE